MAATVSIEEVEGYWDAHPCGGDDPWRVLKREPYISEFANYEAYRGKRVLELGCGQGRDAIEFARAGARVEAIDLSEVSLRTAREKARNEGLGHLVTFRKGNIEELSSFVAAGPYDLVYSYGALHHTPFPEKVIGELEGLSRVETEMRLMLYNKLSLKGLAVTLGRHSEAYPGCPVVLLYTRRSVRALLGPTWNIVSMGARPRSPFRKDWRWDWLISCVKV